MDEAMLIERYNNNTIGKRELGALRRLTLERIIHELAEANADEVYEFLNKNRTKIDLNKLADKVKYGLKAVNIRQSFKTDVLTLEEILRSRKIIDSDKKNEKQKKAENTQRFIEFIEERLTEPSYVWPVNQKGALYRKGIWAFFLDMPIDEINYTNPILASDASIKTLLADIDVKIARGEVMTASFASNAALDEINDTMESAAIASLRQILKETQEKLVEEREARISIENELNEIKQKDKLMLGQGSDAIKAGSIH